MRRCVFALVLVMLPALANAQSSAPSITANPNPVACADGRGTTTVAWTAGTGPWAEVWVSIDGAPETLFGGLSPHGSQSADWINAGLSYEFRLYEGSSHKTLLASVDVRCAVEAAFIRASPNPVPTDGSGSNGKTLVEWNTGTGRLGKVYLSINGGREVDVARGARGTVDVAYIRQDTSFVFRLYDEQHQQLDAVEVLPRLTSARLAARVTFAAALLFLIAGSLRRSDRSAVHRKFAPLLACVMTLAALLPVVTSHARPMERQPFPDAPEYADAAVQLASGNGYKTYVHDSDTWPDDGQARPPKYPPGFSLALLPFAALANTPDDVLDAAKWFAAVFVIASVWAGWAVGGPVAGMMTAGLIGVAPFGEQSATVLLADAFGAALTAAIVALLSKPTKARTAMAGALAGFSVLVRFSLIVNIAALAIATRGRTRLIALSSMVPALAGLFLYQWLTFGSPLKTGYDYWSPGKVRFTVAHAVAEPERAKGVSFSDVLHGKLMRWVCPCPEAGPQMSLPNYQYYPAVLAGLFWVFSPPLVTIAGVIYLWRHPRDPAANAAIWMIALTVGLYVVNFFQNERFMAPPAVLLTIFAGVAMARWLQGPSRRISA